MMQDITQHDPLKPAATLWMGELDLWMDENFIKSVWYTQYNEIVNVKIIRDRYSGISAGYCFVEFASLENATRFLNTLVGLPIPGTTRVFKLNWANGNRQSNDGPEYAIFVGDIGNEVNNFVLLQAFQTRYPSAKTSKVMIDTATGASRGYGFVKFSDKSEQQRAMVEMQGHYIGSRPIRVSIAATKSKIQAMQSGLLMHQSSQTNFNPYQSQQQQFADPENTTVFIGGLPSEVGPEELKTFFLPYGEIVHVKVPPGKGCGFVQFAIRENAETAIQSMTGYSLAGSRVRLSWGKFQNDPSFRNHQQEQYARTAQTYQQFQTRMELPQHQMADMY